jgi:hypothetical protein
MSSLNHHKDQEKAASLVETLLNLLGPEMNVALSVENFRMIDELYVTLQQEGVSAEILAKCFEKPVKSLLRPVNKERIRTGLSKPVVFISYSFSNGKFKKYIEEIYIEGFLERLLNLACCYCERDLQRSHAPGEQIIDQKGLISSSQILIAFCTKDICSEKNGSKIFYPSGNVIGEVHSARSSGLEKILVFREEGVTVPSNLGTAITWIDFKKRNLRKIFLDTIGFLSQAYALQWIDWDKIRS